MFDRKFPGEAIGNGLTADGTEAINNTTALNNLALQALFDVGIFLYDVVTSGAELASSHVIPARCLVSPSDIITELC